MSFDDIHNVANEYFHVHVSHQRSFTHHVGTDEANFFLHYKNDNSGDFLNELKNLHCLPQEWTAIDWSEFNGFQVTRAETWMDFDNLVIFTTKTINQ